MNLGLSVSPGQRLIINAVMQQGLCLLTVPRLELRAKAQAMVNSNPFLEFKEERLDRSKEYIDHGEWGFAPPKADSTFVDWEAFTPHYDQPDLNASLVVQVAELEIESPLLRRAVEAWLADLDPHGRITSSPQDIAIKVKCAPSVAESALALCRTLEPRGLFAYNIHESWALQLHDRPDTRRFVEVHMCEIMQLGIAGYCKQYRLSEANVRKHIDIVRQLRRSFSLPEKDSVVTSDVEIMLEPDGGFDIQWIDDFKVQKINRENRHLWEYGAEKWTEAATFARMLLQRRDTIMRVVHAIASEQKKFIRSLDVKDLLPMNHAHIADMIGLHQTTVGRAISGKSVKIGVKEIHLADFFSARIDSHHSTLSVQQKLAELIREHPSLSDEQAVHAMRMLHKIDIARRTITKYRAELGIRARNRR